MAMRRIFISHPFCDDPEGNMQKADQVCQEVISEGAGLPISPLHLFSAPGFDDTLHREGIMTFCMRMIDACDEVWVYGRSRGCDAEERYARNAGKKVVRKYA